MTHKRLLSVVVLFALILAFMGTSMAGTLEDIVTKGELRVAVQSGVAPYAFVDKHGKQTGSMVEFAEEMATRMGVKLKVLNYDWDGLIPSILSGKVDILMADMTPTLKRALKISFSDPWLYVKPAVFTKMEAPYKTLADIDKPDITVGVVLGTTSETNAKRFLHKAKIKSYRGNGRMVIQALLAGHIDAGINDDLAVLVELPDYPPNSIRLFDKRLGNGKEPLSFGVRQDSVNLLQWINLFLTTIQADGTFDKNIDYWFRSSEWRETH